MDTVIVRPRTFGRTARAYLQLTKPRVIELLLVVTVPTMMLAAHGVPNLWLLAATLIGGAMSAGSAGAFNCYIDREADRVMRRTKNRPLVTGELSDREALAFAWVLGVVAIMWLAVFTNWMAAGLALVAILLYVVLYSLVLKRRTEQNIVWGGVAGCMPVLIGWAAVAGGLSATPAVLFVIIFLWTPPHYWPLSMKYREDYAAAGIPMLAVLRDRSQVAMQVVLYTWATVAASLLLIPIAGMGWVYIAVALGTGAWFLAEAHRLYTAALRPEPVSAMRVFHTSIGYLTLLFIGVALDPLLHV